MLVLSCLSPCHPVDSRLRGNDGIWLVLHRSSPPPCGYCLEASMTPHPAWPRRIPPHPCISIYIHVSSPPSGLRIKSAMTGHRSPPCGYCLEASMTPHPARPRRIPPHPCISIYIHVSSPPCGYCLEASMTPHPGRPRRIPPHPCLSIYIHVSSHTLWIPACAGMTVMVDVNDARHSATLWIADQVRNDGTMRCIVFTLTFDSSPIKGEGIRWFLESPKKFLIFLKMYCDKFVICSKVI